MIRRVRVRNCQTAFTFPMPGSADFVQRLDSHTGSGRAVDLGAARAGRSRSWYRPGGLLFPARISRARPLRRRWTRRRSAARCCAGMAGKRNLRGRSPPGNCRRHGKNVAAKIWIDTYNAPLPPLVDAIALLPVNARTQDDSARHRFTSATRMIAIMSMLLFLASVAVLFFLARRLFDQHARLPRLRHGFDRRHLLAIHALRVAADAAAAAFQPDALRARARDRGAGGGTTGRALARRGGRGLRAARVVACAHDVDFSGRARFLRCSIFVRESGRRSWCSCRFWFSTRRGCSGIISSPAIPAASRFYSFFDQIGMSEAGHMRQLAFDFHGLLARLCCGPRSPAT